MNESVSLAEFISSYPFPAFVLSANADPGVYGPSLLPVFTNIPFRALFVGSEAATEESAANAWIYSLSTVSMAKAFSLWLVPSPNQDKKAPYPLVIELNLAWAPRDLSLVKLQLVQTHCGDGGWVITSVPLSPLPLPNSSPAVEDATPIRRPVLTDLRLADLPQPRVIPGSAPGSSTADCFRPVSENAAESPKDFEPVHSHYEEIARLMDGYPWENTVLGPKHLWPESMRNIISIMLHTPYPCAIWYGPELNVFYNAPYAELAGNKHPALFGTAGAVAWREIWDQIGQHTTSVFRGEAVARQDDLLFLNRLTERKLPEETYHSWSWVPIPGPDGTVVGLFNFNFETTLKIINARRLKVLRNICERVMLAPTIKVFGRALLEVLSDVQYEGPFAALYRCTVTSSNDKAGPTSDGSDSSPSSSGNHSLFDFRINLIGSLGIPGKDDGIAHPMFPPSFSAKMTTGHAIHSSEHSPRCEQPLEDLRSSQGTPSSGTTSRTLCGDDARPHSSGRCFDWAPLIAKAMRMGYAVHTPNLPPDLMDDVGRERGWKDRVREAVVIPIVSEDDNADTAVLILGINTRRPYNEIYSNWIDVMRMTLGSALHAVLGREAETRRADQLAQLDAAKTAFFSNASHELRTPLTLIDGPLNEALAMVDDRHVKARLALAARNTARLSRLVDSLLDFSRIEGGKLTGRFRPMILGHFTADLASLFRSIIEKNGIGYIVDCDIDDQSIVYVDPEMWEKVVFNLIGNAFKYTLEGIVTVRMRCSPQYATFQVSDTGVGIPPEDIDRIFDRFHRVTAISRSYEGTGIGLALTRELVRLHGGHLTVASQYKRNDDDKAHGSTFTVNIPMGYNHIPRRYIDDTASTSVPRRSYARGIIDEAAQWGRGTVPDVQTLGEVGDEAPANSSLADYGSVFFKKNDVVLVVDDNTDMRRYIRSIFSDHCTVAEACHGQEALDLMTSGRVKPDIVVTDRTMPILDGDGLLQAMHSKLELRWIPIIMVTADASEEARLDALLSGADDYISKPFTAKQLLGRTHLQMQIGRRKLQLEAKFEARSHELRILSELAPVGIFRADTSGHIIWANPVWHELTGRAVESICDWLTCIVPEDRQSVQQAWRKLCEPLQRQRLVMEFSFIAGRCVQAQFNILDVNAVGTPSILGTLTDISERRMLQQAQLDHAEEREAAARHQAEESEVRRQEAEERRRAQELLIDVTSHELRQPVSAILNCATLVRSNYRILMNNILESFNNQSGFIPSAELFASMEEDLEALDAIYQCGLSQERIANDVLIVKDNKFATLHSSGLASIVGVATLIFSGLMRWNGLEICRYLAQLAMATNPATDSLIFKSLSRMQLEVLSILPVKFSLADEVKRICSLFQNELRMKDVTFSLGIGSSLAAHGIHEICLDKARFAQIVTNLLSNAIKFTDITPMGHREIHMQLEVSTQAPKINTCLPPDVLSRPMESHDGPIFVFVSVKDSGPGLKPEDLALLFQRFAQGSNSHEVFGGSGLGLFVSRKLCELMGGRIEVDSKYGQGATFRFFVQGAVQKYPAPDRNIEHVRAPPLHQVLPVPPPKSLRVLITEDNQINQAVLNRQLRQAGCQNTLASNGAEALEAIKSLYEDAETMFDVILMDCEMPVMNGYTTVREIRKMESQGLFRCRNFVIALTGNARQAQVQSALDAGMDHVIIKPYRIDELLQTIRQQAFAIIQPTQPPL